MNDAGVVTCEGDAGVDVKTGAAGAARSST